MKPLTEVRADLGGGVIVRRGTPLVDPVTGRKYIATCDPWPSTGAHWVADGTPVMWAVECVTGLPSGAWPAKLSDLVVDTEDATGRAHVAWALNDAQQFGMWNRVHGLNGVDFLGPSNRPSILSDLDPTDDTRIPDGSRWVDAEALARVAVHVLGGAS